MCRLVFIIGLLCTALAIGSVARTVARPESWHHPINQSTPRQWSQLEWGDYEQPEHGDYIAAVPILARPAFGLHDRRFITEIRDVSAR